LTRFCNSCTCCVSSSRSRGICDSLDGALDHNDEAGLNSGSNATDACLLTGALFFGVLGLMSSAPDCILNCVLSNDFCFIDKRSHKEPLENSWKLFCESVFYINLNFHPGLLMSRPKFIDQHGVKINDMLPGVLTTLNRGLSTLFASPAAATTTFTTLTGINVGTDTNNRIGNEIFIKFVEIRAMSYLATTPAPQIFDVVRIALIYDYQPTGALPVVTDVYGSALVSALYAYNSSPRFKVLREWFFCHGTVTTGGVSSPPVSFLTDFVEINLPTVFKGPTGTIANQSTGALYYAYTSATGSSVIDAQIAFYYEDK